MKFSLALVLCLSSLALSAMDELAIAREALRDGLWEIARNHAGLVTETPEGTNVVDEARLVILESFAGEGKWDQIGRLLTEWRDLKGDGFDYYRAIVRGDHAMAMEILKRSGSPEGLVEAKMFEAECLAKDGKRGVANGIWREIALATNVRERVYATACANLMDEALLRNAFGRVREVASRRLVGLRLGTVLLRGDQTFAEGEKLVRAIAKDYPDSDEAREAFLAVADAQMAHEQWKAAADTYHEAIETWPDLAKRASVHEWKGWVLKHLGRKDEALESFGRAFELATAPEAKAVALLKQGDLLQEMGKDAESMAKYRLVLRDYPNTAVAKDLQPVVKLRELEAKGRDQYRNFKFAEAMKTFAEVVQLDATRSPRMQFFSILCLYGQGRDDDAGEKARKLSEDCADPSVRSDVTLWLAKFLYNRREWKDAGRLFQRYAGYKVPREAAADALLWAARAAAADTDYSQSIQLSTRVAEQYADTKSRGLALLVQGESLIELARFDEAVLIFERVSALDGVTSTDRNRAQMLRADALYAMGADNPSRYVAALEAYRSVLFGGVLTASEQIVMSYKIARTLEKLKRKNEAMDQYYAQVVLAYRNGRLNNGRYTDDAKAAFSKAAFWLADEYESRGNDFQAVRILELVIESDVPAAAEARKRSDRIANKGSVI